jgi:hypothetical protein
MVNTNTGTKSEKSPMMNSEGINPDATVLTRLRSGYHIYSLMPLNAYITYGYERIHPKAYEELLAPFYEPHCVSHFAISVILNC